MVRKIPNITNEDRIKIASLTKNIIQDHKTKSEINVDNNVSKNNLESKEALKIEQEQLKLDQEIENLKTQEMLKQIIQKHKPSTPSLSQKADQEFSNQELEQASNQELSAENSAKVKENIEKIIAQHQTKEQVFTNKTRHDVYWLDLFKQFFPKPNKEEKLFITQLTKKVEKQDPDQLHLSDFYCKKGINIDLTEKPASQAAQDILLLMKIIKQNIENKEEDTGEEAVVEAGEEMFFEQLQKAKKKKKSKKQLLQKEQVKQANQQEELEPISLNKIDRLQEVEVKTLAVSILAATNGEVGMAQNLLKITGIKMMKAMTPQQLKVVKTDLQLKLSQYEEEHQNNHHHR